MLLRHAKTERAEPGERDRDRKLMKRGRNDAPVIGAYMAHHGLVPDLALVSPATRAQETWALVGRCFAKTPKACSGRAHLQCRPAKAHGCRSPRRVERKSLLLVGHNPSLHELAVQLIASGDVEARERIARACRHRAWSSSICHSMTGRVLRPQSGRLERFVSPRLIAAADRIRRDAGATYS